MIDDEARSSRPDRQVLDDVLNSYVSLVRKRVDRGWAAYYIVPNFERLRGNATVVLPQMLKEAGHAYAALLKQVGRADTKRSAPIAPIMIVAPDAPENVRDWPVEAVGIGQGLRIHGVLVMPPRRRINLAVEEYFREQREVYAAGRRRLSGVSVRPIGQDVERAVRYVLKRRRDRTLSARPSSSAAAKSASVPIASAGLRPQSAEGTS